MVYTYITIYALSNVGGSHGRLLDEISAEIPEQAKGEPLVTALNGPGRFFLFASLDDAVKYAELSGGTIAPVTKMYFRYRR